MVQFVTNDEDNAERPGLADIAFSGGKSLLLELYPSRGARFGWALS
ncbi:hypothetical protein [Massilia sp. TWR1-2-2]